MENEKKRESGKEQLAFSKLAS